MKEMIGNSGEPYVWAADFGEVRGLATCQGSASLSNLCTLTRQN